MIRNILILTFNDLAVAFKNKTLYLILFVPLFVFLSLKLVDGSDPGIQRLKIGLLEKEKYPPAVIQSLRSADRAFAGFWLLFVVVGKRWLKEKNGDGILVL